MSDGAIEYGIAAADVAESDLVTSRGVFRAVAFRDPVDGHGQRAGAAAGRPKRPQRALPDREAGPARA